MRNHRTTRRAAAVLATALVLTACGDDGDSGADDDDPTTEQESTDDTDDTMAEDDTDDEAMAESDATVITTVDYAFQGLDSEYESGTTIQIQNDSEAEVHELLAFRRTDGEERPVSELLELPQEELLTVIELRGAAVAPPGQDSTALPIPPLVLEQPGNYIFICLLPTGAPPDEVLAAIADFAAAGFPEGEAPDYPETGPPHAVNGMFAEVTITAAAG